MAAPKTSLNPKARPRTKTEEKTLRGRPVWIDHTGEVTGEKGAKYSEVTTTIPWGTEWITAPSIDENGKRLSDDEVKQRLLETRGKDFITGEELPTFSNPEKASEYAMWRSDTMFDQEAIEQGFPEEFPMEPEPERKDFIDRSIDKGKDFLEYLTTPSKHGVFNQGGDVAAQTDNLFGYTDEAVTKEVDKYKEDVNTELSFKDAATFVAEATPIIGDALAAKEVYDELQKDDPNYLLVGALGGAALVGLIPGLGDAAASAIKTGAKKALDTAKRIEVDPNTLGIMGGNINLTPKATNSPDEPKNYAYRTDNPATKGYEGGEEWLEGKQKTAEDRAKNSSEENSTGKLLSGSITGYMGQDFERPLFLSTEMLSKLKGANDEKRYVGEGRYDLLRKRVDKEGFDPEQKYSPEDDYGNAIVVGVNHKGEAFIIEGNTRVAVAKDLDVPSVRAEIKYYNGAEEVDGPYSPQNIIQYADKPKDFNKGGAVMNEQMEMAFMQQGGLKDDGMKRDPVSGNEVPSGSMAKEVRDDISANLSEGEYVVPADVVRFFGVKFFEDLRAEAKMGLQTMEANGRIGGEPVDEPMQDEGEMSDEEFEQLIRQELGSMQMAEGGMVPDMNEDYGVESSAPVAFNEGGYEPGKGDTGFNPFSYIGLGSTLTPGYVPPPEVGTESPVESESSCAARGLIYNPNTKMCDVPQKKTSDNEETGSDVEDYTPKKPEVDYFKLDEESLKALGTGEEKDVFGNKVLKAAGVMMSGPITLALGAFSAAKQGQSIAQLRAAAKVAEVRGLKDTAKLLNTRADTLVGNSSPLIQGLDDLNLLTGNNYFADQVNSFGAEAELGRDEIALGGLGKDRTDKEFKKLMDDSAPKGMVYKPGEGYIRPGSAAPSTSPKPKTRPSGGSSNNDNNGPSAAQIAAQNAAAAAEKEVKESKDKPQGNLGASSGGAGAGGFGGGGGGGVYAGGRATGGLVSRPKKK